MKTHQQDLGFIILKLMNTPVYDNILKTISTYIHHRPYNQHVIFNSYSERIAHDNIPVLHIQQAQFFTGDLVLFDLPSIIVTNKFPNIKHRFLYTNDTPWMQSPVSRFKEWESIYLQENLNIIVPNQHLYNIYKICWKEPIAIVGEFNYELLESYI